MRRVLFLVLLLGCSSQKEPPPAPTPADAAPNPATVLPPGTPRVVAPGIIEPWEGEVEVAGHEMGVLYEIFVKEGDVVAEGQLLARLDDSLERAQLAAQKARVAAAEAEKKRARRGSRPEEKAEAKASAEAALARATASREAYEREKLLFEKGASTQEALDRAKRQAEADEAQARAVQERAELVQKGSRAEDIDRASAELEVARAELARAEAALARREIRAPRAGTVLALHFDPGEFYSPENGPLLTLGDVSRLQVKLEVDELDVPRVSLGQRVLLTADGYSTPIAEGKIIRLSPRMGAKTLTSGRTNERKDTRVREVFCEIPTTAQVIGLRVWATIEVGEALSLREEKEP